MRSEETEPLTPDLPPPEEAPDLGPTPEERDEQDRQDQEDQQDQQDQHDESGGDSGTDRKRKIHDHEPEGPDSAPEPPD